MCLIIDLWNVKWYRYICRTDINQCVEIVRRNIKTVDSDTIWTRLTMRNT